jgi:hypothetical protein
MRGHLQGGRFGRCQFGNLEIVEAECNSACGSNDDRHPKALLFSIRPVEVKRFQASAPLAGLMFPAGPCFSSGSALWLFQHGTRRMRRPNLTRVVIAPGAIRTRAQANSPHPSSREGHLSASGRTLLLQTLLADGSKPAPKRSPPPGARSPFSSLSRTPSGCNRFAEIPSAAFLPRSIPDNHG